MLAVTVIYDILRDGIGAIPIALATSWLFGALIALWVIVRPPSSSRRPSRLGLAVWLLLWLTFGGIGFGNVFYQHFRCRAAAASGNVQIVEGTVTNYHPEEPGKKGDQETLTVSGQTWTYYSANLGAGGYRGKPSAKALIEIGALVRISNYNGRILKLELLERPPNPRDNQRLRLTGDAR